MAAALGEAARVLEPGRGFLYVAEPATWGPFHELYRPFHDETAVRALARTALAEIRPRFARHDRYRYGSVARYADFEAFVTEVAGASYNRITREMVDRPDVRALFEAGHTADGYTFEEVVTLDLYRGRRRGAPSIAQPDGRAADRGVGAVLSLDVAAVAPIIDLGAVTAALGAGASL